MSSTMMSELLEVRKALKAQMKVIDRMMKVAVAEPKPMTAADAVVEAVAEAMASMASPEASPEVAVAVGVAVAKPEPAKPKSKPMTAHTAFTKHLLATDYKTSPEYLAFLEKRMASAAAGEILYEKRHQKVVSGKRAVGDKMSPEEAKVGAHIPFIGHYRSIHPEEYQAFEAKWNAAPVADTDIVPVAAAVPVPVAVAAPVPVAVAAPVAVAVPVAAPVPVAVAAPVAVPSAIAELIENYGPEATAKPKRVMTDAHKAAMKAGREKAAAAKKAMAVALVAMAEPAVAVAEPMPADLLW